MILDLLQRIPAIRFILHFDQRGGVNFGSAGFTEHGAAVLHDARVIHIFYYKPFSPGDYRKVTRRYRKIVAGPVMPRLARLLRQELREANLASIADMNDGHGRVALMQDWNERRDEVKAAVARAWDRLQTELEEARGAA